MNHIHIIGISKPDSNQRRQPNHQARRQNKIQLMDQPGVSPAQANDNKGKNRRNGDDKYS